jgi:hypothetical protein
MNQNPIAGNKDYYGTQILIGKSEQVRRSRWGLEMGRTDLEMKRNPELGKIYMTYCKIHYT